MMNDWQGSVPGCYGLCGPNTRFARPRLRLYPSSLCLSRLARAVSCVSKYVYYTLRSDLIIGG